MYSTKYLKMESDLSLYYSYSMTKSIKNSNNKVGLLIIDMKDIMLKWYNITWKSDSVRPNLPNIPQTLSLKKISSRLVNSDDYNYFCFGVSEEIKNITTYVKPNILALISEGKFTSLMMQKERKKNFLNNTNADLTPGGNLVSMLDIYLYNWISNNQFNPNKSLILPSYVIYNNYKVPGDFEYKLATLLKTDLTENNTIIYSSRNETIDISLLSKKTDIYIMNGSVNNIINIDEISNNIKSKGFNVIDYVLLNVIFFTKLLPTLDISRNPQYLLSLITEIYKNKIQNIDKPFLSDGIGIKWNRLAKLLNFRIDNDKYREEWYSKALNPKGDVELINLIGSLNIDLKYKEKHVKSMCMSFIQSHSSIFNLYCGKTTDWGIYYPYHYTPLLSDICKNILECCNSELCYMNNKISINRYYKGDHNLFHQLLAVLPMNKCNILPKNTRHLMGEYGELSDLYPLKFSVENNEPLIPFADIDRIMVVTKQLIDVDLTRYNDRSDILEFIMEYKKKLKYSKSKYTRDLFE